MRVSIGILAHNVEPVLDKTIESLLKQEFVRRPPEDVQAVDLRCLANGCRDATARVAREAFDRYGAGVDERRVRLHVHDIPKAGKSNAWNELVHRFAPPDADFLVLMDADVVLMNPDAIGLLVETLRGNPDFVVTTGQPTKHLVFKKNPTLFDRISLSASRFTDGTRQHSIAGCLYCIRGPFARSCWMPIGLQVEDGFLRAMVVTDQFRQRDEPARVQRVPDAVVCFEAYTSIESVLRHEIRLMTGTIVNSFLYGYLWSNSGSEGAGRVIERNNGADPGWFTTLINEKVRARGSWVVPRSLLTFRLSALSKLKGWKPLRHFPIALVRTVLDWYIYVRVNGLLRSGRWGGW